MVFAGLGWIPTEQFKVERLVPPPHLGLVLHTRKLLHKWLSESDGRQVPGSTCRLAFEPSSAAPPWILLVGHTLHCQGGCADDVTVGWGAGGVPASPGQQSEFSKRN